MSDYIADTALLNGFSDALTTQAKNYDAAVQALLAAMQSPVFTGAGGDAWKGVCTVASEQLPIFSADLTKLAGVIADSATQNQNFDDKVSAELSSLFGK